MWKGNWWLGGASRLESDYRILLNLDYISGLSIVREFANATRLRSRFGKPSRCAAVIPHAGGRVAECGGLLRHCIGLAATLNAWKYSRILGVVWRHLGRFGQL